MLRRSLATQRAEPLIPLGWRPGTERLGECLVTRHVCVDLYTMIEVVCEGGVDVSEREVVLRGDFVRASAEPLVPHGNVLDRDSTTTDAGPATCGPRRHLDVLVQCPA